MAGRRTRRDVVTAVSLALTLATLAGSSPAGAGETIRINGSGAALDMMTLLNDAYAERHPEVRIVMEKPLGSSGALKALQAGVLDLVVSSKKLTAEQAAQGLQAREFGQTPLAIVTEMRVPKTEVTTRELEEIYGGRLRRWPNGESIRIILRPQTDIDTAILRGLSPEVNKAVDVAQGEPGLAMAVTDPEAIDLISRTPGGIGTASLCSLLIVRPPLNVLALNRLKPTTKGLADRTYPLAKEIRFVTTGSPPQAVTDFLAFVYSAEGRAIVEGAGVLVTADGPTGKGR